MAGIRGFVSVSGLTSGAACMIAGSPLRWGRATSALATWRRWLDGRSTAFESCPSAPADGRPLSSACGPAPDGFGSARVCRDFGAALAGLLLTFLLAGPAAHAANECGAADSNGVITCDENDQSSAGDGIGYSFSNSSDYTINFGGTLAVTTTSSTDQDPGFGLNAVQSGSGDGDLTINMSGGSIDTSGQNSHGLRGLLTNTGSSGTLTIKMSGGGIDTDAANGIMGVVYGGGNVDVDLTSAIPAGTCDGTTITGCDIHTTGEFGDGLYVTAQPTNDGDQPTGDVAVDMVGGDILTEGQHSRGIYARNYGSGSLAVSMSGGSIRTEGHEAHGIYSLNANGSNLILKVTGGTITTTGSGARGIYVWRTGGALDPVVVADSTISAAQADAITLDAVPAKTLTLRNSTIQRGNSGNAIWYRGSTDDTLAILGGTGTSTATTTIAGDVAFGGGTDTLLFNTCLQSDVDDTTDTDCTVAHGPYGDLKLSHTGDLDNLEKISKIGSGEAELADLSASGAAMALEDGDLRLTGHLDLGSGSTSILTIHDTTKLIFDATSNTAFGKITAHQVKFDDSDWQRLFVADDAKSWLSGKDVLVNTGGSFVDSSGTEITTALSLYSEDGQTTVGTVASGDSTVSDGVVTITADPPPTDPVADNNECGAAPSGGGTITCNQNTYIYQTADPVAPADAGIEYNALSGANNYTINLSGAAVTTTANGDYGLHAEHSSGSSGSGNLTVNLSGGSIDAQGSNAAGIFARLRSNGTLTVNMSGGSIKTKNHNAIHGRAYLGGSVNIDLTDDILGGTCTSADKTGCDIHTTGDSADGVSGLAAYDLTTYPTGNVAIDMAGGNILTEGKWSQGIYGENDGLQASAGTLAITMSGGSIETGAGTTADTGQQADGIYGHSAAGPGGLTISMSGGSITTGTGSGANAGNGARGINALNFGTGTAAITLSGGRIHTHGGRYTRFGRPYDADGIYFDNDGKNGNTTSTITMSGGSIDTEEANARGIHAVTSLAGNNKIELTNALPAGTCDGTTNTGCDIHTRGASAHGIYSYASDGTQNINEAKGILDIDLKGGDILTEGTSAYGIHAEHEGSGAIDIDMTGGDILTEGTSAYGIYGLASKETFRGSVHVPTGTIDIDMTDGDILTKGNQSHGIYGKHEGTNTVDIDMTGGDILTEGDQAHGIFGEHTGSGAVTIDLTGGSIDTEGLEADGIYATVAGERGITIELTDDIAAGTCTSADSSGCDIHTRQNRSVGVHAINSGSGEIDIDMADGDILTQGTNAHGINTSHTGSDDTDIDMTGGSITTTGSGARGIYVHHTSSGTLDPVVVENGTISAAQADAITLNATPAKSLTLRNATITRSGTGNAIWFSGSTNDTLDIRGHRTANQTATTTIRGNVAFGGGTNDSLEFNSNPGNLILAHTGSFTGLEKISKTGAGELGLASLSAAGAAMTLEDGDLRLTGHLDLGSGSLTIRDTTKLIFGATSATAYGRITANQVKFDDNDWQKLYLANGSHDTFDGKDVLVNASGNFVDSAGSEITTALKLYDEVGDEIGSVASGGSDGSDGTVTLGTAIPDTGECGAVPAGGGTITCNQTTYIYQSSDPTAPADPGIEYDNLSSSSDYTINVSGTIDVDTTAAADHGLHGQHAGSGDLTVAMSAGSVDADGAGAYGVYGRHEHSGALDLTLSGGSIDTGGADAYGLYGRHDGDTLASSALSLAMSGGSIVTDGLRSHGVHGWHTGSGRIDIDLNVASASSGNCNAADGTGCEVWTKGNNSHGVYGLHDDTGSGVIDIDLADGDILTDGTDSHGIFGYQEGGSSTLTIDMTGGSVQTTDLRSYGIYGRHAGIAGNASDNVLALKIFGGSIRTKGYRARGVFAGSFNDNNNSVGSVLVELGGSGSIVTEEDEAEGISATHSGSGGLTINLKDDGSIVTKKAQSHGIYGNHIGASGDLSISLADTNNNANKGGIRTEGRGGYGIYGSLTGSGAINDRAPSIST